MGAGSDLLEKVALIDVSFYLLVRDESMILILLSSCETTNENGYDDRVMVSGLRRGQ